MPGKEQLVCKLKKSLYGLKQALRQWYLKFNKFMISSGFTRLEADHCCYSKWFENSYIMLLLYVNDMLVVGSSMSHEGDCEFQGQFSGRILNEGLGSYKKNS